MLGSRRLCLRRKARRMRADGTAKRKRMPLLMGLGRPVEARQKVGYISGRHILEI